MPALMARSQSSSWFWTMCLIWAAIWALVIRVPDKWARRLGGAPFRTVVYVTSQAAERGLRPQTVMPAKVRGLRRLAIGAGEPKMSVTYPPRPALAVASADPEPRIGEAAHLGGRNVEESP